MWITLLCVALGIKETMTVRTVLTLWAASEEAPVHWNNPLGCTRAEVNSWPATGAGVQAYPTIADGMNATARELRTQPYAGVLEALETSAGLEATWGAINVSAWRPEAQEGHYPLALFHAWQAVIPTGPLDGEVDLD
jgi:hypothetical protein